MKKNLRTPGQVKKHRRFSPTRIVALLAMVIMVVGVGSVVFSQSGKDKKPRVRDYTPARAKDQKKYVATKEIIFDKASRKLRKPTTEETAALVDQISSLTNRSTEGLTVEASPKGGMKMSLEGRFGGVMIGRDRADGTTEVRCVTSMDEAVEFLGLEESNQ